MSSACSRRSTPLARYGASGQTRCPRRSSPRSSTPRSGRRRPGTRRTGSSSSFETRSNGERRKLGIIYRKASDIASAMYAARGRPPHLTEEQFRRLMASGSFLWDHLAEAPVILVPCQTQPKVPPPETLPPDVRARHLEEQRY